MWQNLNMPEARVRLQVERSYTAEEYARLARGFVPKVMEDKWFIFLEADWLYLHRSWSGFCVYQVRLESRDGRYVVAEAWANRDAEQYSETDAAYDARLLLFLIDRLLLGYDAEYPAHTATEKAMRPIQQWSSIGPGRSRDEPPVLF